MEHIQHLRIQLEEIKQATNNFGDDHFIGEGRYGKVYKGDFLHEDRKVVVAVKRLNGALGQGDEEFCKEVMLLSSHKHENLISLVGFCDESDEKILVYDYAANKSLDLYLTTTSLTWIQRLKICLGAARGLQYLHNPRGTQQRVLHGDMKSGNILLDQNWNAKIADFGLSNFGNTNQQQSFLVGTMEYCDPMVMETMTFTIKSDIYSFGVILFEVLCSRRGVELGQNGQARLLPTLAKKYYEEHANNGQQNFRLLKQTMKMVIGNNLWEQIIPACFKTFIFVAYQCVQRNEKKRPSMDWIVSNLENAVDYQEGRIPRNVTLASSSTERKDTRCPQEYKHLRIGLEDIKQATDNFGNEHYLGSGGFGKVYRADFHSKGLTVAAVKCLDRSLGQGDGEFWKEVMFLSNIEHENVITLLGFCDESGKKILVYEYAPKRSLDFYLRDTELSWIHRLKICLGAARGLEYLHNPKDENQRVIHRDIKSGNILLDENWNAKIADFGLSKYAPANQKQSFLMTLAVGTMGYCDPMYIETMMLTKESDVYSFGIVLFEVLCSRRCVEIGPDGHPRILSALAKMHYQEQTLKMIIDESLWMQIKPACFDTFTEIAYQCLQRDRKERPSMELVVSKLETALQYQEGRIVSSE